METCDCGWELPESVMPVPVRDYVSGESIEKIVIESACVILNCPRCRKGHSFFHPVAAELTKFITGKHVRSAPKR